MNKKFKNIILAMLGVFALIAAMGLNFQQSMNDYGIIENNLHTEILAQTNCGGGGEGCGPLKYSETRYNCHITVYGIPGDKFTIEGEVYTIGNVGFVLVSLMGASVQCATGTSIPYCSNLSCDEYWLEQGISCHYGIVTGTGCM